MPESNCHPNLSFKLWFKPDDVGNYCYGYQSSCEGNSGYDSDVLTCKQVTSGNTGCSSKQ